MHPELGSILCLVKVLQMLSRKRDEQKPLYGELCSFFLSVNFELIPANRELIEHGLDIKDATIRQRVFQKPVVPCRPIYYLFVETAYGTLPMTCAAWSCVPVAAHSDNTCVSRSAGCVCSQRKNQKRQHSILSCSGCTLQSLLPFFFFFLSHSFKIHA